MAISMDGRKCAQTVYEELKARIGALKGKGIYPKIALILVGEDPSSAMYVRMKGKRALEIGMAVEKISLPADIPEAELKAKIRDLNADPSLHGILVQLPLPEGFDTEAVLQCIDAEKDVDGITEKCTASGFSFVPCTPKGILRLIRETGEEIEGKHALVAGRSKLVGKPTAELLLKADATVTVCHSKSRDLALLSPLADILVVAVGKPGLIKADMVKPGAIVVDVGQSRVGDAWMGDTDFETVRDVAGYITPPTGGVGPMTIAMLMENTVEAAEHFGKNA